MHVHRDANLFERRLCLRLELPLRFVNDVRQCVCQQWTWYRIMATDVVRPTLVRILHVDATRHTDLSQRRELRRNNDLYVRGDAKLLVLLGLSARRHSQREHLQHLGRIGSEHSWPRTEGPVETSYKSPLHIVERIVVTKIRDKKNRSFKPLFRSTRINMVAAVLATALGLTALSVVAVGAVNYKPVAARSNSRHSTTARHWLIPHDQVGAPVVQSPAGLLGSSYLGVSCSSAQECVAVGSNGNGGSVSTTNNGGATWTPGTLASGEPVLESVNCVSLSQCVAVGQGVSVRTNDGGATWTSSSLPTSNTTLLGVDCPNSALCVSVGVTPGNAGPFLGQLLISSNGGATWSVPSLPPAFGALGSVSCPTATFCVSVGASILVTNDGGRTWSQRTVNGGTAALRSVSCQSATVCVAVGGNPAIAQIPTASAFAVTTTDGGATWTSIAMPPGTATLSQVSCSSSACQAAGSAYNGAAAPMLTTSDGGTQWTANSSLASSLSAVNAISCISGTSCVFVGANGTKSVTVATVNGTVPTSGPVSASVRSRKDVTR